jgi:hypothetical protein
MSVAELLPALRELTRVEKLRVMQFLVHELAREEGAPLEVDAEYPVWSPYDSFEAAAALLDVLSASEATTHAEG